MSEKTDGCKIVVADLFALINKQRKAQNLAPVENSALVSRCMLRFNLGRQQPIDFNQATIEILEGELGDLESMINDQFACYLDGDISRSLVKRPARRDVPPPRTELPMTVTEPESDAGADGVVSKFKRLFGGK